MLKRPTKHDTEEDLLRMQEEFLQQQPSPSVKLVKKPDKRRSDPEEFSQSKDGSAAKCPKRVHFNENIDYASSQRHQELDNLSERTIDENDSHIAKVLTDVLERDIRKQDVYCPIGPVDGGFPKVLHRGNVQEALQADGKQKRSLFAQHFMKSSAKAFGVQHRAQRVAPAGVVERDVIAPISTPVSMESGMETETVLSEANTDVLQSQILRGDGLNTQDPATEVRSIHEENVQRLQEMSQEEILAEQQKLLQSLDPGLVALLKHRKTGHSSKTQTTDKPTDTDIASADFTNVVTASGVTAHDKPAATASDDSDVLPFKPDKRWLNMAKIEYDKLEWTKSVAPPTAAGNKTGSAVRFDFQGSLVASDADVPTHLGLHHHGDEPERAGYSLQELFQLSRSTNMQQRVMSLNTLANIVHKARHGAYHELTSKPVLPALLDGGLLFIIRWALDDSADNSIAAAVNCLHRVLVCEPDEQALDATYHWYAGGHRPPALRPQQTDVDEMTSPGASADDPDKPQETDADVIKRDIIEGLLRMHILPRMRYILDKCRPNARVVTQVLDILTRIARHSAQAAYNIQACAGLLDVVVKEFLPSTWQPVDNSSGHDTAVLPSNYGYPVSNALKLMRVLCTASRHIAGSLQAKYGLMDRVIRYIAPGSPKQLLLLESDALFVYAEAFRLWHMLTCYGLAAEYYTSCYGVVVENVQRLTQSTCSGGGGSDALCLLLCPLLEAFVLLASDAAVKRAEQARQQKEAASMMTSDEDDWPRTFAVVPDLQWSQVVGLFQPIKSLLVKQLTHFRQTYFETKFDLGALSCLCNFVACYYACARDQADENAVDLVADIEAFVADSLVPCLTSQAFQMTLQHLRMRSLLLFSGLSSARAEIPANVPEVGALIGPGAVVCPLLQENSSVHFASALTRLCLELGQGNKRVAQSLYRTVLEHDEMLQYVRKLCICRKSVHVANYFCRFENTLQYNLVLMAKNVSDEFAHARIYHQMALYLLVYLQQGQESYVHDVMRYVVFSPELLRPTLDESAELYLDEALQLQEEKYLTTAAQETVRRTRAELLQDTRDHLASIQGTYMLCLQDVLPALELSRCQQVSPLTAGKQLAGDVTQLLLPVDWVFLPLIEIYNDSVNPPVQDGVAATTATTTASRGTDRIELVVLNTLRWLHLLECKLPRVVDQISVTLKLSRLMCVFMAGTDLFLEPSIHAYMLSLLKLYCKPATLDRLDLGESVPGLTSFHDLYLLLIGQFEAVSFGDSLFASYVILPLQQRHDVMYRRAVWGEHSTVLRALTLPLEQVVLPVSRFLEPDESHVPQVRLYFQALFTSQVTARRTPLPYLIAVHHVNRFVYTQDGANQRLKEAMLTQLVANSKQEVCRHVIYYKKYWSSCVSGLELYEHLPKHRQALVDKLH